MWPRRWTPQRCRSTTSTPQAPNSSPRWRMARPPRAIGLPRTIRFHDLRHAHATLMLRAGVPLKVASGRLGHGSIGITADLYQHVAQDLDADAAAREQQALRGVRA